MQPSEIDFGYWNSGSFFIKNGTFFQRRLLTFVSGCLLFSGRSQTLITIVGAIIRSCCML
ncbi:MAG: hypothetical protein CSA20_02935 [Deltaproteobacteria bacterium]|nr:MAG: hypothetical protein CSA20_02935 [Deltaproteobacteria bacterium]